MSPKLGSQFCGMVSFPSSLYVSNAKSTAVFFQRILQRASENRNMSGSKSHFRAYHRASSMRKQKHTGLYREKASPSARANLTCLFHNPVILTVRRPNSCCKISMRQYRSVTTEKESSVEEAFGKSTAASEALTPVGLTRSIGHKHSLSECYFAGKGAALVLPPNERARPSRRVSAAGCDIQQHLQSMFYLLRPEETLKMGDTEP
ncbi:unnamed protein product [Trichogramma brassicae]|uniref:Uncharacterized protein n=1 Tax=Trichogramma brassicae TaxID=86971 RepID=A0A6H5IX77_9HYME|nr:unnamed protein product [Trichogramma brassicae]